VQNLREEVAMDVDEDEDGTQRPRKVQDFGIEVNFESLDDEEREVRDLYLPFPSKSSSLACRTVLGRKQLNSTPL
jgi:hypothetical protein